MNEVPRISKSSFFAGPFKLEVHMWAPYRTVFHDFLTEREMDWMIEYSKPRLSKTRQVPDSTKKLTKAENEVFKGVKSLQSFVFLIE